MKSTLSITVTEVSDSGASHRTIEVPCRLPEAFNFKYAGKTYTATVVGNFHEAVVEEVEDADGFAPDDDMALAERILATIKATLGIAGPVPPGSPLPAIALAYEAEVAAHEAQCKVLRELPRSIKSPSDVPAHPSDDVSIGFASPTARMLAKYVEHVVEQAAKVTP